MEKQTIHDLWPIARAVGRHMQDWHDGRGGSDSKWFSKGNWDGESYVSAGFAEPGVIEYRLNHSADIRIVNMTIKDMKPGDIDIGPIEPIGPQRVVRADIMSTRNSTLEDIERELKYRDLEAQSYSENVANEVSAGMAAEFSQSVGYGSEVAQIQGETSFKLSFEAAFKRAWDNSSTRSREHEIESVRKFLEKAMHNTVVERIEKVGPARQVIRATGELRFGCRVHSSNNFIQTWESMDDFIATLKGIDNKSDEADWHVFYRQFTVPENKLEVFRGTVNTTVEKIREFEETTNVEVDFRAEPLNDEARFQDALKLVALQAKNPRLRKLAEKALGEADVE